MNATDQKTIGEIVADDYRTAAIFQSYGIDFCCKGNRTIVDACESRKINTGDVYRDLETLSKQSGGDKIDYASWPADLLADYIEKKHHRYVEERSPLLNQYLDKLCKVHGDRHPELFEVAELFKQTSGNMAQHMKKEELVLFPFIRKMEKAVRTGQKLDTPHFGKVENPINMMEHEHAEEGERLRQISALTNGYTPPADGCNTYRVTFQMLDEFEKDLHLHIHLENNILFPTALRMEKELRA